MLSLCSAPLAACTEGIAHRSETSKELEAVDQSKKPVTIKKYANRRLYNTETSTYVTLDDLAAMVREERDFVVYDAKTGEDLTHSVLTQIILEQESRGQNLLPINFLRQLIRFYGDNLARLVPSYLEFSIETLTREQEKFRKHMAETWGSTPFGANPFGTAAFEAMQEQARQNMAMFERAFTMFSPFGAAGAKPQDAPAGKSNGGESAQNRKPHTESPGRTDSTELAEMRRQLEAMQRQLDKLSKNDQ
jgi:polyhydroxyalkanoate synthesis repressor PhaR